MTLPDEIRAYVDQAVQRALSTVQTAVGTVVTSPSQVSTNPLAVVIDGSSVAVPVKGFRALPVFPGARVALVKFGSDWTVVGAYTNPGAGTGSSRIVIGSDVPTELRSFGIDTAILTYITDKTSGMEVGYFFIGGSNRFDGGGDNRVQAFGNVVYPTPGNPASATTSNVKTNFQQQMWSPYPQTTFKDQTVDLWTNLRIIAQNAAGASANFEFWRGDGNLGLRLNDSELQAGQPGTTNVEVWHTATLQNSWTGTLKYLKIPFAGVWIAGNITPGTKTDGTTIFNLPVGYRPATALDGFGSAFGGAVSTAQSMHYNLTTGGNFQIYGFNTSTGSGVNCLIPLTA